MFIYVSGPYSAPGTAHPSTAQRIVEENLQAANQLALQLARKGHIPFVPHTMMRDWEDAEGLSRERAMELCHEWVQKCDALFLIGTSPGADSERRIAVGHGMPIYRSLEDIPDVSRSTSPRVNDDLSDEAVEAHLAEYTELWESYRHTYQTIYQVLSVFAIIAAGILTFSSDAPLRVREVAQVVAPIPIILWFLGIYLPMNRYGELRLRLLVDLEEKLSQRVTGLDMHHARVLSRKKDDSEWKRVVQFKWLWRPRVVEVMTLFGISSLLLEAYLVWTNMLTR